MNDKLARVSWETGQPLMPEHLVALEDSILADTMMRFRILGLPFYGVGELKLNGSLLSEGVFSIETLSLVTSGGDLLHVPGNARIAPLNLNLTGLSTVSVYLHVLMKHKSERDEAEEWSAEGASRGKRWHYDATLSAEQECEGVRETIKLAEVNKNPEGVWYLAEDYVPPLIQLGASPFLEKDILELYDSLDLFRTNLSMDSSSYVSGDSLYSVKQCLKSVTKALRTLGNIRKGIHLHPFHLYEEVQVAYTDVCFYRNANPEKVTTPYDHNRPVFLKDIMERLRNQMQLVRTKPAYVSFKQKDNLFTVELPDEIRMATDVYFLAQKKQLNDQISIEGLKVAGSSRLPFVHKMALHGIPMKKIERPPFQHSFGSEVEFYQIMESEEWDRALNERSLAFFSRPDLADANFYVYWRSAN